MSLEDSWTTFEIPNMYTLFYILHAISVIHIRPISIEVFIFKGVL
jgi:hypothetical protein